jgi:Uma2 family endonuclease
MPATATLADLLHDLGGISPNRVRMRPFPGTATERDVLDVQAKENRLYELVDGVLVEKAMGFWESVLAVAISSALRTFVIPRKLGVVAGSDGMVRLFPHLNLIRMPDVVFVSNERLAVANARGRPVPQLAPDLAVEVLGEGNTVAEMSRKRREYFEAGVRLVWIVDPQLRTVDVYTGIQEVETLREGQRLDGGDVLPEFSLDLAQLFSELDGQGPDAFRSP